MLTGFKSSDGAFPLIGAVPRKTIIKSSNPVALSTMAVPPQNGLSIPICGLRSLEFVLCTVKHQNGLLTHTQKLNL